MCSTYLNATTLGYNGKCQFTMSRESYAYCLEKELVFYQEEFKKIYSNLTPAQSLEATEAIATQIKEPDCEALAKTTGGGLEYYIVYRICLINITKEKIVCVKRFTTCSSCIGRRLFKLFKKPYTILSIYVSGLNE